jgi:hypothetical protein
MNDLDGKCDSDEVNIMDIKQFSNRTKIWQFRQRYLQLSDIYHVLKLVP